MGAIATKHCYCAGSNCYYYCYGLGDGFFQQPVIKVDLLIIQVRYSWKKQL